MPKWGQSLPDAFAAGVETANQSGRRAGTVKTTFLAYYRVKPVRPNAVSPAKTDKAMTHAHLLRASLQSFNDPKVAHSTIAKCLHGFRICGTVIGRDRRL